MPQEMLLFGFLIDAVSASFIIYLVMRCVRLKRELDVFKSSSVSRQEIDSRASYASQHDALTGLPNKEILFAKLEHLIATHATSGGTFEVVYLDIEGFGALNKKLGEIGANAHLSHLGVLIRKHLSDMEDVFAYRLAGDELVFIVSSDAELLCDNLLSYQDEVGMKFRIGICQYPTDGRDTYELIQNAETAMLSSKDNTSRVDRYNATLELTPVNSTSVRESLRTAFDYDEFDIVLQPIVDLQTGKVAGAEVLIRWNHRKLGSIPPSVFIPLASELGILPKMDTYVLLRSLQLLKRFNQHDWFRGLKLTINLSVEQLESPLFLRTLLEYTRKFQVEAKSLALEIPSEYLSKTPDEVKPMLSSLSGMGFTFIINEFGSSYGSLIKLRKFSVTSVKIEPSFLSNVLGDKSGRMMLKALVDMATSMDIKILAGGIETAEQVQVVYESGVQLGQGYFICKPLRATQFQEFVEKSDSVFASGMYEKMYSKLSNRKPTSYL